MTESRPERPDALRHRSPTTDLDPHRSATRKLLRQPMPGQAVPEAGGILIGTSLDADLDRPTVDPHEERNAALVREFTATFSGTDYVSPTHAAIQSHPRLREASQRQRHRTPLDAGDPATRRLLNAPESETDTTTNTDG